MGRIKGTLVKRISKELLTEHKDAFSSDFGKNKEVLNRFGIPKKIRNSIAGYVARKIKKEEQKVKTKK